MRKTKLSKNSDSPIVFSTQNIRKNEPLADEKQESNQVGDLRVRLEKKGRGGKPATLIKGFQGSPLQAEQLTRQLKTHCGVGGAVTEDGLLIQGDQVEKVLTFLQKNGFAAKKGGG
jgi:translation initiation factor 1